MSSLSNQSDRLVPQLLSVLILMWGSAVEAGEAQWTQEILLDNDRVLMVRNTFPPGKSSGLHTHVYPQRTVYVVQGGRLQLQPADPAQPARTIEVTTGSALMLPAQSHNIRNVGETTVILIETELKAPEAVVQPPQQ